MIARRSFLLGLGAAVCAPAIIRPGILMPVKRMLLPEIGSEEWFAAAEAMMVRWSEASQRMEWLPISAKDLYIEPPAHTPRA